MPEILSFLIRFLLFIASPIVGASSYIGRAFKGIFELKIDENSSNLFADDEDDDCIQQKSTRFLDKYSKKSILAEIYATDIPERLKKIGIDDWFLEFDLKDPITHKMYVRTKQHTGVNQFVAFIAAQHSKPDSSFELLFIRWFALQNPLASFTEERPRLPGQNYPGTGLGYKCVRLTYDMAKRAGKDGILNSPEHFHNAYMYNFCYFVDPLQEGWFRRLRKDLEVDIEAKGLAMVSWAIYLGFLNENGKQAKWEMKDQTMPISVRYFMHFISPKYVIAALKAKYTSGPFTIDWESASKCFQKNLLFKNAGNS